MARKKRGQRHRGGQGAKAHQRLDIQGLRMVAVMLVVLSHLFDWPRGGFIGVDVFFVISGFLITGSLMHTVEKTGSISFSSFYRRRVRRILPAATLVLVVTVAAAYFVYGRSGFRSTALDSVAAFFFVSNWRFGIEGTDYFTASGPVSPLQHYWSLSVEEQFYFVWPAVIFVIAVVATRMAWTGRARIALAGGAMGAVVLASFTYSVLDTATNPTWAYFSTLTRVWELGVGALLAITIAYFEGIPDRLRPFIAWAGLIMIGVGAFAITETGGGFPAPWAAVPVLGAALIICAGVGGSQKYLQVLTNRVSTYIGDISYSLYLWHWPVIILLAALMDSGTYYYIAALFLMFGFSIASYHFFENPIRASKWLETGAERNDRSFLDMSRWRLPTVKLSETNQSIGIGTLALVAAGLMAVALVPPVVSAAYVSAVPSTSDSSATAVELTGRAKDISDALRVSQWPADLSPSLDDIANAKPPEDSDDCGHTEAGNPTYCTYGSGNKLAVVVGDSISITWLSGIREALVPLGYKIVGLTRAACPAVEVKVTNDGVPNADCNTHHDWVPQRIAELKPDVVIASGNEGLMKYLESGAEGEQATQEWQAGAVAAYRSYAATGAKVVVLSPAPAGKNPQTCVKRTGGPATCVSTVQPLWRSAAEAEMAAAAQTGAKYVDTQSWFCTTEGICPMFVGSTTMRRDTVHITPQYSKGLAPELADAILLN
nr:acyltransferase family protein [Rhodococcus sp. AD45]